MSKLSEYIVTTLDNRWRNPDEYFDYEKYFVIDNYLIKNELHPRLKDVNRYIDEDTYNNFLRDYVEEWEVLMTLVWNWIWNVTTNIGGNCVIIQNTIWFRTKDTLDDTFLYYYFRHIQPNIKALDRWSSQPSIKKTDILELDVDIPSIDLQVKISSLLKSLDLKIELNNKINSELEAMAKELYEYWFVQFDFPDENGKPYKSSGWKMVWNEEVKREIPEGWEVKKAKDICPVVTGKEDANFSTPNWEYKFFTCSQDTLRCNTPAFEWKSILIAWNGVFNVKYYNWMFNAYQRTYVLIPDDEKYVGVLYLVSKDLIDSFTKKSAGSIVKFITKGDVEWITLLDPHNDKLLNQINSIIETIAHNIEENDNLSELRDFLLPMLMNGQVVVK